MKPRLGIFFFLFLLLSCAHSKDQQNDNPIRIAYLHHSTGELIWNGRNLSLATRIINKLTDSTRMTYRRRGDVPKYLEKYNRLNDTQYMIESLVFPKAEPYGWNNYPFDYYNIWVAHNGDSPFLEEPTLEILTKSYDVIVFKHCFPSSNIERDTGDPDIGSDVKSIENYRLQYNALKDKMKEFPDTKFILWTIPALRETDTDSVTAVRADAFYQWVIDEWNDAGDNVFIWDFRAIETEGGLFLYDEYTIGDGDSHPNNALSERAAKLFVKRLVDVVENDGKNTSLTGE